MRPQITERSQFCKDQGKATPAEGGADAEPQGQRKLGLFEQSPGAGVAGLSKDMQG